ncbi:MAG: hypothetical protein HRT82_15155 [Henriciella sp.]|nr:hypothetical protein [Henriciella sp.]
MDARSFQTIKVGEQAFAFDVMVYGGDVGQKQPLLIFHSIEFAMPPSEAYCQLMWDAGLQVVFARRPGYGASSPLPIVMMTKGPVTSGATAIAEAAMLRVLIDKLGLTNIVLMPVGSANPICYRLVHMLPDLDRVLFVNPVFNQDIMQVFHPSWFRQMLKQMISSKSGLRVAESGMKLLIKNDPIAYYRTILKKSQGDMAYVEANARDYKHAGLIALETTASMLHYDSIMCLTNDPLLKDGFFAGLNASILIGSETTDHWRREMQKEAQRLNLPLYRASTGDIFCAYASPQDVLAILRDDASAQQRMALRQVRA